MVIKSDHAGHHRALLLVTQGSRSANEVLTSAVALGGMASAAVRQEILFTALRQGPKIGPMF